MLTVADPYRVLQVLPDAEPEVIQAAYRALARKYHPDMGGSEMHMAMLNAAWETLRDQRERARYDLSRRTAADEKTTSVRPNETDEPTSAPTPAPTPAPTQSPRPTSGRARSGTVLDFGRYAGLSLGELAVQDRNYLEWLQRTPVGRRLQREIEGVLTASRPTHRETPLRSRLSRRW